MGSKRSRKKTTNLEDEAHALLSAKAEATGLSKQELASKYISIGVSYNLQDQDWEERIKKNIEETERPARAKRIKSEDCPALAETDKDGFVCCRNAPSQKKLGDGKSGDMKEVCGACVRIKGIIEERDLLREQVKAGIVVDIPSCIQGGRLSDDGKRLYCKNPKLTAQYRSVKNWCKVMKKGANCDGLRWTRVDAKGKFADPEK